MGAVYSNAASRRGREYRAWIPRVRLFRLHHGHNTYHVLSVPRQIDATCYHAMLSPVRNSTYRHGVNACKGEHLTSTPAKHMVPNVPKLTISLWSGPTMIGNHMTLRIPAAINRLWWSLYIDSRAWANIYGPLCEVKTICEIFYVGA